MSVTETVDPAWPFPDVDPDLLRRRAPVGEARRLSQRQQDATDYRAYLEARYDAAEGATRGVMRNARGLSRGVDVRRTWFAGRMGSLRYASEELAEWFALNGATLTATDFHSQHRECSPNDYVTETHDYVSECPDEWADTRETSTMRSDADDDPATVQPHRTIRPAIRRPEPYWPIVRPRVPMRVRVARWCPRVVRRYPARAPDKQPRTSRVTMLLTRGRRLAQACRHSPRCITALDKTWQQTTARSSPRHIRPGQSREGNRWRELRARYRPDRIQADGRHSADAWNGYGRQSNRNARSAHAPRYPATGPTPSADYYGTARACVAYGPT